MTKLSNNQNALRDDIVEGYEVSAIKLGQRVVFIAPSRDSDTGYRMITTSTVRLIIERTPDKVIFDTVNSRYQIDYL